MILKWICYLLVCLDTLSYIISQVDVIRNKKKTSSKVGGFVGLCAGLAARVYVLYGAGTCWLSV